MDPDRMLKATARVPEHVVHRSSEKETVLLNLETGQYHGLNETGARLLELLQKNDGQLEPAMARLADEYAVSLTEIGPDLIDFCSELESRGLIELAEMPEPGAGA